MGVSSSKSSSTNCGRKYDVFISFRGEDIRENFKSHLCDAFYRKKVNIFVDDKLRRGDAISPALLGAIEESKTSVVIFLKDYASSKWCLDELVKILECKKLNKQIVIPVFYHVIPSHVIPSHVRHQTGSFKDAFDKHDEKLEEMRGTLEEEQFKQKRERIQRWRAALFDASSLSGLNSKEFRSDSRLVNQIVEDVLKRLNDVSPPSNLKGLIGIESRIEEVKSLLCIEKPDFRIVGIWGMGGIGKTTIAGAVFDHISGEFEGKCFLKNVREESEKYGLHHLLEEILSELFEGENLKFRAPYIPEYLKRRLQSKKVLIVLDDVTSSKQLEDLCGGIAEFGSGSRIIITTRDKHLLDCCEVHNIYEVKAFNEQESFQLFCRHAFKQDHCPTDLLVSVHRVVDYAKFNPLALKIIGSSLYGRDKEVWERAVYRLEGISSPQIYNLLRISYDGLDVKEKNIFLDIVFFFKGSDRSYVTKILNGCYLSVELGLEDLIDKSLITISKTNQIEMHDLLQEMGWKVVSEESSGQPSKCSRLHDHKHICHVLSSNNGTDAIRGIFLDMSRIMHIDLSSQAFEKLCNLRFLKFHNQTQCFGRSVYSSRVRVSCGLKHLPNELRYLHWDGYPSERLPSSFSPKNLVKLDLSYSNLEQLWDKAEFAPQLRWLILCHSRNLTMLPDLSAFTIPPP